MSSDELDSLENAAQQIVRRMHQHHTRKRDRRILHQWDRHNEVSRLIGAVQMRPMLWNDKCPEYKMPHLKNSCWNDIATELNINGVDAKGAKDKWNSIRNNFKACLIKYRARRQSTGGRFDANIPTTWLHFSEMMFIEKGNNDVDRLPEPAHWDNNDCIDTSILNYLSQPIEIHNPAESNPIISLPFQSEVADEFRRQAIDIKPEPPSTSSPTWDYPIETAQPSQSITITNDFHPPSEPHPTYLPRKRSIESTRTACLLQKPPKRLTSNDVNYKRTKMKDLAAEVLSDFRHQSRTDRFSIFGNYIAEHLRNLTNDEATTLESRLSQTLFNFLGSRSNTRNTTENIVADGTKKKDHSESNGNA